MSIVITTNAKGIAKDLDIGARELRNVLDAAVREAAREIKRDYQRVTSTWDHKVDMIEQISVRSGKAEALVGTDDPIFHFVDQGTKPHLIFPRRAKALRFASGYKAKTQPNHLWAGAGGPFGHPRFAAYVQHPGTKPRKFTQLIQRRADRRTPAFFEKHLRNWAKRRGKQQ